MYAVNEDKSKATMSEPETITIRNDNEHSVLELTKIGCVVYFTYYTTEATVSDKIPKGTIPIGYRPTHNTKAPVMEYMGGGMFVYGTGLLEIFEDGRYVCMPDYNNGVQKNFKYSSGCYITEE